MRVPAVAALLAACVSLFPLSCTIGPLPVDGKVITTSPAAGPSVPISLSATRGAAWMHESKLGLMTLRITPQIIVWVEDSSGGVTTLYATRAFGKQDWKMAGINPDSCGRPTCAPYWLGRLIADGQPLPTKNHPLPDAVTAATPLGSFTLNTAVPSSLSSFSIFVEINKSFDNNPSWPEKEHMAGYNGQPPVVFRADVNLNDTSVAQWPLVIVGISGDTQADTSLRPIDVRVTTARDIIKTMVLKRR